MLTCQRLVEQFLDGASGSAWGAASGDDLNTVHKLDAQEQRALQAVQAAELAAGGEEHAEALSRAIASTMKDIARDTAGKLDLPALVARVMGPDAIQEPGPDTQLAAS